MCASLPKLKIWTIGFSNSVSKLRSDADTITSIKDSSIDAEDILAKANSKNEMVLILENNLKREIFN